MRRRSVILGLLPDRIELVVQSGSERLSRRFDFSYSNDQSHWLKALGRASKAIRQEVVDLNLGGVPTHVVYRSPTHVVDLSSVETASPAEACEGAMLSCADALPYPIADAVCASAVVARDRDDQTRRTHVVVAAERDDVATEIAELVEDCGLRYQSATPLETITITRLMREAMASTEVCHCWLHIGEQTSFCVGVANGNLRFGRRVGVGLRTFVTALTRPIRRAGADPVELSETVAREMFMRFGVPQREAIVHADLEITGGQVLPLIQPALQRFLVEMRQSLRFGLSEQERSAVEVTLTGPGASLAGLAGLLSAELQVSVEPDQDHAAYQDHEAAGIGSELHDALPERALFTELNLLPSERAHRKAVGRVRAWLGAGGVAALILLGVDTVRLEGQIRSAEQAKTHLEFQAAENEKAQVTRERVLAAITSMAEIDACLKEELGERPPLTGLMQELTHLTPKHIRLTGVSVMRSENGSVGVMSGVAFRPDDGASSLEPYIDALRASPLLSHVSLGAVSVGELHNRLTERFSAEFVPILVPTVPQRVAIAEGVAP